jgi:hypothetical protein
VCCYSWWSFGCQGSISACFLVVFISLFYVFSCLPCVFHMINCEPNRRMNDKEWCQKRGIKCRRKSRPPDKPVSTSLHCLLPVDMVFTFLHLTPNMCAPGTSAGDPAVTPLTLNLLCLVPQRSFYQNCSHAAVETKYFFIE